MMRILIGRADAPCAGLSGRWQGLRCASASQPMSQQIYPSIDVPDMHGLATNQAVSVIPGSLNALLRLKSLFTSSSRPLDPISLAVRPAPTQLRARQHFSQTSRTLRLPSDVNATRPFTFVRLLHRIFHIERRK